MRILPALPATHVASSQAATTLLPIGRILAAEVVTPVSGQLYQVRAGQLLLQIESTLPLLRGQGVRIQLQQETPGRPAHWQLLPAGNDLDIAHQLQASLPRQHDPTRLMALLQRLLPALTQPASMPPPSSLFTAATNLLTALPSADSLLTPQGLQRALQQSGLLHEAASSTGRTPPADIKQALLQLVAAATAAPGSLPAALPVMVSAVAGQIRALPRAAADTIPDDLDSSQLLSLLASEAEPVLARLESHQLMHLQQRDSQLQQWLFELPLRSADGIDVWQLHVEQESRPARPGEPEESRWALTLSVDFPETGALIIRLGLQAGMLHAHFHAEAAATCERIRAELPALRGVLAAQGIADPLLTCQRGLPHRDALPAALHSVLAVTA